MTTTVSDGQNYQRGPFTLYGTAYNAGKLRVGDTHRTILTAGDRFPQKTTLFHAYPDAYACPDGVWGFNGEGIGNYAGGHPLEAVTPRQVRDITVLDHWIDIGMSGPRPRGANGILDLFVTGKPNDFSVAPLLEIDVALWASDAARAWIPTLPKVGTILGPNNQPWAMHLQTPGAWAKKVLYPLPPGDFLWGWLDILSLMAFAQTNGLLTGGEWYQGHCIGCEPVQGSACLTINRFASTYAGR